MPRLNGYEATKQIRSLKNRPDAVTIPIIAMTANAFAEDIQASLESGMNAHIQSPLLWRRSSRLFPLISIDRNKFAPHRLCAVLSLSNNP